MRMQYLHLLLLNMSSWPRIIIFQFFNTAGMRSSLVQQPVGGGSLVSRQLNAPNPFHLIHSSSLTEQPLQRSAQGFQAPDRCG